MNSREPWGIAYFLRELKFEPLSPPFKKTVNAMKGRLTNYSDMFDPVRSNQIVDALAKEIMKKKIVEELLRDQGNMIQLKRLDACGIYHPVAVALRILLDCIIASNQNIPPNNLRRWIDRMGWQQLIIEGANQVSVFERKII